MFSLVTHLWSIDLFSLVNHLRTSLLFGEPYEIHRLLFFLWTSIDSFNLHIIKSKYFGIWIIFLHFQAFWVVQFVSLLWFVLYLCCRFILGIVKFKRASFILTCMRSHQIIQSPIAGDQRLGFARLKLWKVTYGWSFQLPGVATWKSSCRHLGLACWNYFPAKSKVQVWEGNRKLQWNIFVILRVDIFYLGVFF